MLWAYGLTTVPERRLDLLPRTLDSLARGGYPFPRLFIDGARDASAYADLGCEVSTRWPTIRTQGNWTLGLAELYFRYPEAERFAMFQDDFITYRNLRQYLEACSYPADGYWNLYTFPRNQEHAPKTTGWYLSNQRGLGAVALVFSREVVQKLLTARHIVDRVQDKQRGWKAIDGGIVTALKHDGISEYVHNPSLVQHVGSISSMRNRPHQQSPSFRGEDFDAMELLR